MPHNVNSKLITSLIIFMLLDPYFMKIEIVNLITVIIVLGIIAYLNKNILKELSIWQNLGILIMFVGTVALLVGFFYFVANPVAQLISIQWISYVVRFLFVIGTLFPAIELLYKGLSRITNGKFPISEIELAAEAKEYPKNEEVQQLVRNDRVIEAVKLARKLYGYSLLKAKRYVDSLR